MAHVNAMDQEDKAENFHLLRRFSELVRESTVKDEPLALSLVATVDSDVERERKGKFYVNEALKGLFGQAGKDANYYDDLAIAKLKDLEFKSNELETIWQKFTKDLKLSDDNNTESIRRPDMDTARIVIETAQSKIKKNRKSKFGKAKIFFGISFKVLNQYSFLFALLPSGDRYTSVFTGALSAIVKATITHDKITTEISDAFDEISDQVRTFWYVIKHDSESTYTTYHISLFYFELFGFMVCIMREWLSSSWKRFSRSLGNSFLENSVRSTLQTLRQYTTRIESENTRRQAEITQHKLDYLGASVKHLFLNQVRDTQQRYRNIEVVVHPVKTLQLKAGMSMGPPPPSTNNRMQKAMSQHQADHSVSEVPTPERSRDDILADVDHLSEYLQTTQDINKLVDLSRHLSVITEISVRLHKWAMNTSSEILWMEGPAGISYPGQGTLISAFMLGNIRNIDIAVIVDFIQPDIRRPWNPEKEFLHMVYALIYQAAYTMPETIRDSQLVDFSASRFIKLDGNTATLPEALTLLSNLLHIGPPLQFLIMDGLQLFDGRHMSLLVRRSLRDLISLLHKAVQGSKLKGEMFKVLLSTEGGVEELARWAGRGQISRERFDDEDEEELLLMPAIR